MTMVESTSRNTPEIKHATTNLGETSVKYRCIFVTSRGVGFQNCVFWHTLAKQSGGTVYVTYTHITYSSCTWLQLNGPKLDLDTQRWRKGPLLRIHSPWLSNKHHIQGLLSLLLFLKYFSSLQISFLWPGGCSGHSQWCHYQFDRWWRWWFTALGEILLIFMIRIVFSRTKSFRPKGITGFVLATRGKFIIGIIEQHLPETDFIPDFMSSKTYSRKSTASRRRCCSTSSHLLLSTCHTWSDLQGALWHGPAAAAAELGSCGRLN